MKTKILILFLALAPVVMQAQDAYSTNADGSIYTYSTNADGSANIVAYAGPPWAVTIPTHINGYRVTSIVEEAFADCYSLTSITIPNSVTNIGDETFENCLSLTNIAVAVGNPAYSSVGGVLFDKTQATLIQCPGGLGGSYAIPNSVTSIGDYAFNACESLTSVTIGNSVTNIGEEAFSDCYDLTSVTIGNGVTSIGEDAFEQTALTSMTIPDGVTSIGDGAFSDCYDLTGVTIGNGVTNVGDYAFVFCYSLTNVTIGDSVTSIGEGAFFRCTGLKSVTMPDSVTNIGDDALEYCYGLTSVTIGNSVTSIGDSAFAATGLTNVTIPNGVTIIGDSAFADSALTSVTVGYGVTSIGDYAFDGCSLTSVTIPDSVTSIGEAAFEFCSGLTSVTIGNDVTSIGDFAFLDCYSLTNIAVAVGNPAYSSVNNVLFDETQATLIQFPEGLGGSYAIPNSVTSIGDSAFEYCSYLTSVTIPNSVTSIGIRAFDGCSLTNVTIGNSVTNIGNFAFYFCTNLTSVTIPNCVTSIGIQAFGYSGLTNVTIPNSVTSIGDDAFYDSGLTAAYFQGNAPPDDGTVFAGDGATVYYLPGTTGWASTFGSRPTAPWPLPYPLIQNNNPGFGVPNSQFGFTVFWATNLSIVVEACTNLANPVWTPIATNALASGTSYFTDLQWTNFPMRFYRAARAYNAYAVGGTLTGLPAGLTITLQDNGSDNLTLSNNGTFTFPTALPNGQGYSVTVSGTGGGTSLQTEIYPPVTANSSGTISGANVTNVAIQCTPVYTGNLDVDMYNAAVLDGTANGGVPGVMLTQNGGPFRVTAAGPEARYSDNIAEIYAGRCVFTTVVGTGSCSSTSFPSGTRVIQFGTVLECGFGPYHY